LVPVSVNDLFCHFDVLVAVLDDLFFYTLKR